MVYLDNRTLTDNTDISCVSAIRFLMWAVILVYGDNGLNAILILDDDNFPTMTTIATFICVKEIRYLNHITIFKAIMSPTPLIFTFQPQDMVVHSSLIQ